MTITIYHNPRCSKSRQTLQLLEDNNVNPEIVEYLKTPPSAGEIRTLVGKLGQPLRELVRTGEAAWQENDLDTADDDQIIAAMVANPILLQRPIVVRADKAIIGRPPENVLELLK